MVLVEVGSIKISGGSFSVRIWVNGRQLKDDSRLPAMILAALDSKDDSDDV